MKLVGITVQNTAPYFFKYKFSYNSSLFSLLSRILQEYSETTSGHEGWWWAVVHRIGAQKNNDQQMYNSHLIADTLQTQNNLQ